MDINITDGIVSFNGGILEIIVTGVSLYIGWIIGNVTFERLVKPQLDKIFYKNKTDDIT